MIFRQYFLTCLAQASYLIGSDGVAAVVDPQRDIDCYLEDAAQLGLGIAYVIETHLHADFVSGHRELAERTGAKVLIGARAGATFPHLEGRDGDEIILGDCTLRVLETPGHTLESISLLVTDRSRGPEPCMVLTGDTLFIGDVGRPDLGGDCTPRELAGMLYDSLYTKLLTLPDAVEVYPAHGAGSLCGRAMRADRSSTIGVERATNAALQARDRDEFIARLTRDIPERPAYFVRDVAINRDGAASLNDLTPLDSVEPLELRAQQILGAVILDTRDAEAFGAAHVPGSINIGLDGQFASWAATVIGLEPQIILVAEDATRIRESRVRLARVGIERVTGYLQGGIEAWLEAGLSAGRVPQIDVDQLFASLSSGERPTVIDVRRPLEWADGHIEGAMHLPLSGLPSAPFELDERTRVAVICKSGYRSSIASSILLSRNFRNVSNVSGGFDAWQERALPVCVPRVAT